MKNIICAASGGAGYIMYNIWKPNWEESKKRHQNWWKHNGFIVGSWAGVKPAANEVPILHTITDDPGLPSTLGEQFLNYEWRASSTHYGMARQAYPLDILPHANIMIGPGSLSMLLGSEIEFRPESIWFHPIYNKIEDLPTLKFDENNKWWQFKKNTYKAVNAIRQNFYMNSCMDYVENIDILASLVGVENTLIAMMDEPEWVETKMKEINKVWIEAFDRTYDLIKNEDGSSAFYAFSVWGDGKTGKLQCDASSMMSPNQFEQFIIPVLTEQCKHLNHSLYHLDGKECICHLDNILRIKELDCIEWTPNPTGPGGADPYWFDMYKKILASGKNVQIVGVKAEEIKGILDGIGTNGVNILSDFRSLQEAADIENMLKQKFNY